eukprot:SAG22_NODE_16035_length_334_cov_0.842553_1_plen_48_part_01
MEKKRKQADPPDGRVAKDVELDNARQEIAKLVARQNSLAAELKTAQDA